MEIINQTIQKLEDQMSFACVGYTICDNFEVKLPKIGHSLLDKIK